MIIAEMVMIVAKSLEVIDIIENDVTRMIDIERWMITIEETVEIDLVDELNIDRIHRTKLIIYFIS